MGSGTEDLGVGCKSSNWHAFETVAKFKGFILAEILVLKLQPAHMQEGVLKKGNKINSV